MTKPTSQELIWQGRIHLGDEPGIYGDAAYSGLAAVLPVTVFASAGPAPPPGSTTLTLTTEGLETFNPYPGHLITVYEYVPDPATPNHSVRRPLAQARFTSADANQKSVQVALAGTSPFRLAVSLECDTEVNPGLYDDFVWLRLSMQAEDFAYYASLGFP